MTKLQKTKIWKVYSRDCYQLSKQEKEKCFLKEFDDFGEAFKYAEKIEKNAAIHL